VIASVQQLKSDLISFKLIAIINSKVPDLALVGAKSIISSPSLPSLIVRVVDAQRTAEDLRIRCDFNSNPESEEKKRNQEAMIQEKPRIQCRGRRSHNEQQDQTRTAAGGAL
jgi:hypothetical protein